MRALALSLPPFVAAGVALLAAPAHAAGFDETTGRVVNDDAAFSLSFDDAAALEGLGIQGYDAFTNQQFDEAGVAGRITRDDGVALEGDGALAAGGDLNYLSIPVSGLTDLIGHRVQLTLWEKPQGTRMIPSMTWYGGDVTAPMYLGAVTFQQTGNVTDDGWEEWTSGPIDFAWAESVPATSLDLIDEAVYGAYGGLAENSGARALIDGLYAVDLGDALVPAVSCTLPTESQDCGDAGLCNLGRCVDAAIHVGQPLIDDDLRNDYVDRRIFEVSLFEGGRAPESRASLVADALTPLKDNPKASTFWPTFTQAYTLLVDGHASAPTVGYPAFQNAGVCVHQGVADLLPPVDGAAQEVPLVFQTGANALAAGLEPGDALVAIDGIPTADWAAQAGRLVTHPGDPEGRAVVTAPQIFVAALDTGAVATFARCDHTDGTPCAAGDVQQIDLDLGALVGDAVLNGESPVQYEDVAACDYRFVRPVPDNSTGASTDYAFAGHKDVDGVRFLVINGVPQQYGQGGQAWFDQVDSALGDDPNELVLDERTGDGGGIDAVDWIGGELSSPGDLYAMDFLPGLEGDDLAAARQAVVDCSANSQDYFGCGNGFRWLFGSVATNHLGVAGDSKLAVLIGLDVSGNDYLTKILRGRTGQTRVFGAGSTWGAFGVIWSLPAHIGELAGGSLQVQDTLFLTSQDDANTDFPTSTGERPDTNVLQRQSDAVQGKDTVIEAAKAWLAE